MKPGDKEWHIGDTAWFLDTYAMRIMSSVVTDVDVYGDKRKYCVLSLDNKNKLASTRAFHSREALCEHYRKIFE